MTGASVDDWHPPFATYAPPWRAGGWCVFPLPARKKSPPPVGFTGEHGRHPTAEEFERWIAREGASNYGIHMPAGIAGIDVDFYKPAGPASWQRLLELGMPRDTDRLTNRADDASGIYLVTIRADIKLRGAPLPAVEILQRHHRYGVGPGSLHPDGRVYELKVLDEFGTWNTTWTFPTVDEITVPMPGAMLDEFTEQAREPAAPPQRTHTGDWSPCVTPALAEAMAGMTVGCRHDTAIAAALGLARYEQLGHPGATAALDMLGSVFVAKIADRASPKEADKEWADALKSARAKVKATPATAPIGQERPALRVVHIEDQIGPPPGVDPETGEVVGERGHDRGLYLSDGFWEARDYLRHIRQAARAAMVGPDAVLNGILARAAAFTPHTVDLPGIVGRQVGLTYYGANIGSTEHGKSSGAGIAQDLAPYAPATVVDMMPIGSGEGFVEVLFDYDEDEKRKVQKWHGAVFYIDEGAVLGELSGRSGSTLLSTLRSAYMHATLGATDASKERKRRVHGTEYVYGITLGIQPDLAGPILADAPAGTPQRFVWLRADDPTMTADQIAPPGPLPWRPANAAVLEAHAIKARGGGYNRHQIGVPGDVRTEIRADRVAAQKERRPLLDAHRMLVRLKVAALLAILDGRLDINGADWHLAGIVNDTSRRVRQGVERDLALVARDKERAATEKHVRRELTLEGSKEARALDVMARAMGRHVHKHDDPDGCASRCLHRATTSKYRAEVSVDDAIVHAIAKGWIQVDGDRYRPGESRPT
jgi:hypothetical protein